MELDPADPPHLLERAGQFLPLSTDVVDLAEATLGWSIADAARFTRNATQLGLGNALNLEHDYIS